MERRWFLLLVAMALGIASGCRRDLVSLPSKSGDSTGLVPDDPDPLRFRAQELPFRYERGETGLAWPVETTGGGIGLLDFDGDGRLDLFFAQGGPLESGKIRPMADVLLLNRGDGKFEDVSTAVGLGPRGYGQGVAVADYDGDGDSDVYVTRYGRNTLWRNEGGRFTDMTETAGVGCGLWSLGAAFADYDGDGDLDLFVARYFTFNPTQAPFHRDPKTGAPDYGMPANFPGQPDVLFRNDGGGHFTDVTDRAGIAGNGRGMGVVAADFDGDARIDFLVANDAMPNALWINRGDGTFEDRAEALGVAVNGDGVSEANMGIAHGDLDGDGLPEVMITHFFGEHSTLWRPGALPDGSLYYRDATDETSLVADTRNLTGWGAAFADFDLDGWLDIVSTNGHIRREPTQLHPYENPPILWKNRGGGQLANVTEGAGEYFRSLHMGRGLAVGDLDDDGDQDLVILQHLEPSVVLWNESPRRGRRLTIRLRGRAPNTDAIGARLTAQIGPVSIVRTLDGGGSYVSASDPRLVFGLGQATKVDRLVIRWPSGLVETRSEIPADRLLEFKEPTGNSSDSHSVIRGQ